MIKAIFNKIGSKVIHSRWNSGLLHAIGGPVALVSLVARGIISTCQIPFQPSSYDQRTLLSDRDSWRATLPISYIKQRFIDNHYWIEHPSELIDLKKSVLKMIVNKLNSLLCAVFGTLVWGAITYGILAKFASSLALFKAVSALVLSLVSLPAFPYIVVGAILLFVIVAFINRRFVNELNNAPQAPPRAYVRQDREAAPSPQDPSLQDPPPYVEQALANVGQDREAAHAPQAPSPQDPPPYVEQALEDAPDPEAPPPYTPNPPRPPCPDYYAIGFSPFPGEEGAAPPYQNS